MANGAAGCGYEYQNTNGMCGFLTTKDKESETKEFFCLKYKEDLEKQRVTGHPFRCTKCCQQKKAY